MTILFFFWVAMAGKGCVEVFAEMLKSTTPVKR